MIYNFKNVIKGNTFEPPEMTLLINGVPQDLTGVDISCWFRYQNKTGYEVLKTSVGSGISVLDATGGKFKIDDFINDWKVATYYYDIRFEFTDGTVKTYLEGYLKVIQNVTNG